MDEGLAPLYIKLLIADEEKERAGKLKKWCA